MGLYRTLHAELQCERCRQVRAFRIQFHWGDTQGQLPNYHVGDLVAPGEVPWGREFESYTDYYCDTCLDDWTRAQSEAFYRALSELAAAGRIRVSREGRPVRPEMLLQEIDSPEREGILGIPNLNAWLSEKGLDVRVGSDPLVAPHTPEGQAAAEQCYALVDSTLRVRGWPYGHAIIRTDVLAATSANGHFIVALPPQVSPALAQPTP